MAFHRHLLAQGRGLAALLRFVSKGPAASLGPVPGPEVVHTVTAPSRALAADFVRFCGGDPSQHGGAVSPLLFPQWTLATMLEAAGGLPYPPVKVINAGFRLDIDGVVEAGAKVAVKSRVLAVDESERGAKVTLGVDTVSFDGAPLLRAQVRVVIPQRKPSEKKPTDPAGAPSPPHDAPRAPSKEKPRVPESARLLGERRLPHDAGLAFAELTGDFNPIHWLGPYARAMRFRSVILHGFGTAAIAFESVGRHLLAGRFGKLRAIDVDFVRPLVLPAKVGTFVVAEGDRLLLTVGDAPSGPAYLSGHCELARAVVLLEPRRGAATANSRCRRQ